MVPTWCQPMVPLVQYQNACGVVPHVSCSMLSRSGVHSAPLTAASSGCVACVQPVVEDVVQCMSCLTSAFRRPPADVADRRMRVMSLRFREPDQERSFQIWLTRRTHAQDVLVYLIEVTVVMLLLGLRSLPRLVCTHDPAPVIRPASAAQFGRLVAEFPCNGTTWQKSLHLIRHHYLTSSRYRLAIQDYSNTWYDLSIWAALFLATMLPKIYSRPAVRHTCQAAVNLGMLAGHLVTLLGPTNTDTLPATTTYLFSTAHRRLGLMYYVFRGVVWGKVSS